MNQATIVVKYVNQPQKNPDYGSVKDDQGQYWSVPKNLLTAFPGPGTYSIEYTISDKGYKNVKSVKNPETPAAGHNQPPTNGHTNGNGKDRFIFMCGAINRAIQAGKVPINSEAIALAIQELYRGYDQAHAE